MVVVGVGVVAFGISSLLPCRRSRSSLFGWWGDGHEKIDLPTLEFCVGRHHHYLWNNPFFG